MLKMKKIIIYGIAILLIGIAFVIGDAVTFQGNNRTMSEIVFEAKNLTLTVDLNKQQIQNWKEKFNVLEDKFIELEDRQNKTEKFLCKQFPQTPQCE